jgi:hypothetical protein
MKSIGSPTILPVVFASLQAVEKRPSAALSGRLTVSAACLHAVVLTFAGALWKGKRFGTQAWQEVAPYSSRRHPSSFVPQVSLS